MVQITQEFESGPLRGNTIGVTLMTKYERKRATMNDHVLTAEELKTGWFFPLNPDHQSQSTECHSSPPSDPDHDQIIWGDRTTAGPKLSKLHRDQVTKVWITNGPPYVP